MKSYGGIEMRSRFIIERVDNLPTWTSNDEGRIIYNNTDEKLWIGGSSDWVHLNYVSSDFDHNELTNYTIDEHRTISDASDGTTDLWSANKINNELNLKSNISNVNRKPLSQAVVLDGTGVSGIQVVDDPDVNFGIGDFTMILSVEIPTSGDTILMYKGGGSSGIYWEYENTNKIRMRFGAEDYRSDSIDIPDGVISEFVSVVKRETTSTAGAVYHYLNNILISTVVIPAGTPSSTTTTDPCYILGLSSSQINSQIQFAAIYNRALSSDEVSDLYTNGIAEEDKWGSHTAVYESDFSAGVDSFAGGGTGTLTGNIDVGGETDTLRFYADSDLSTHYFYRSGLKSGKKHRVTFDYYIPSGNTALDGIAINSLGDTSTLYTTTDAWTSVEVEGIATETTMRFNTYSGNMGTYTGANSATDDLVYIKNVVITQIGATLALETNGIQPAPGQWLDSSSNKLHAILPETGASLKLFKDTFTIKWTNIWNNTHEAQYIGGINQNILPIDNIRIESIIIISTATGGNIVIGDGSDNDRFVQSTPIQSYLDCTIANRNHDSSNRKMIIDPDTNFTGSISTTIIGKILE